MLHPIFKSKRFMSALLGLIAVIITGIVPELQDDIDVIMPSIVSIIGLLIGGYSLQDTAAAYSGSGTTVIETTEVKYLDDEPGQEGFRKEFDSSLRRNVAVESHPRSKLDEAK